MTKTCVAAAAILAALALGGCGGEPEPAPEYPPLESSESGSGAEPMADSTAEESAAGETSTETESTEEKEPPPPPVQVVAAERTKLEDKPPRIRVVRPRDGQRYGRGPVKVRAQVRRWKLAKAPGKHVHLIYDNEPYIAIRDLSKPIDLNALLKDKRGKELEPGTHTIRMFPSRSHHESVKENTPFAMKTFHFKKRSKDFELDADAPLLTYSRPKGCSKAGERVLLDFYISNIDALSKDGHRVKYTVDDVSGEITQWKPHYIENLPEGEHTVRLQLIGPDGNVVEGPYNDTTRTIRVATDCSASSGGQGEGQDSNGADTGDESSGADE